MTWASSWPAVPGAPSAWFPRSFYPFAIGMGYLMPTDFLFSCWFFYLMWKAELIFSAAVGWDQIVEFPSPTTRLRLLRPSSPSSPLDRPRLLTGVWNRIKGLSGAPQEGNEAMSYRGAALLVLAGLIVLVWFSAAIGLRVGWAFSSSSSTSASP